MIIHEWSAGDRVDRDAGLSGELIFRDQADRKQHGIAWEHHFRTGDRIPFLIHLDRFNRFDPVIADDPFHGMAEVERNVVIHQALDIIAGQTRQERHHFENTFHFCTFKGEAAGHDHADIAGTQNNKAFAGHKSFHVHPALGGTGGKYSRWARAGDADLSARFFATAHREDDGPGLDIHNTAALAR